MTLSRRDRAAMTLALENARTNPGIGPGAWQARPDTENAIEVLVGHGDRVACLVGHAADCAAPRSAAALCDWRLLRARLALALRLLLRADAGDFGPHAYQDDAGRVYRWEDTWSLDVCLRRLPVRPLWESAPPHKVSR